MIGESGYSFIGGVHLRCMANRTLLRGSSRLEARLSSASRLVRIIRLRRVSALRGARPRLSQPAGAAGRQRES
jgi:hypothetical protein